MISKILFYFLYGLFLIPVSIFIFFIIKYYIIVSPEYWSEETDVLPDLGKLYLPAFGMYIHFIGGVIIMICGLIQILPISRKYILFHKIIGDLYTMFTIITVIGGQIFIFTNGTVGGLNMDIAFSIYGCLLFLFSFISYIYIKLNNIKKHKSWALRSWILCYSSLFYRLIYLILILFGYNVNSSNDFTRLFDEIIDWLFFIIPLIIMEIFIWRITIINFIKLVLFKIRIYKKKYIIITKS